MEKHYMINGYMVKLDCYKDTLPGWVGDIIVATFIGAIAIALFAW